MLATSTDRDLELEITVRPLQGPDLGNGFLEVIRSFRPCELTLDAAGQVLRERTRRGITTFVAENQGRVVGTAALLVDHKFIHSGGKVGIVEDVIVLPDYQGRGVGRLLMAKTRQRAVELGCYKVCLYCSEELIPYYERLGFYHTDAFLRHDLS
jgi:glucosamine-phosphate N-acetyltransferase